MRFTLTLYLLITTSLLWAQTRYYLPESLYFTVNDTSLHFDSDLRTRILEKAKNAKLNYSVVGIHFDTDRVYSKILVPQTFTRLQLVEQAVLYFSFIAQEENMKRERVLIYPFFVSPEQEPFVQVNYLGEGQFKVRFHSWETVPLPPRPTLFEAEIYNLILDKTFNLSQSFETIPEDVFEDVAEINHVDISVIKQIYEKVHLWQKSQ